jgi:hypothetical protein
VGGLFVYDQHMPARKDSVHRLLSFDELEQTAVCAECGPVALGYKYRGGGRRTFRCSNAIAKQKCRKPGQSGWKTARRRHGLTGEEAARFRQGKVCEICAAPASGVSGAVDHCHQSLAIRGVLCHACNRGLGSFRDDPDLLAAAITYLQKPGMEPDVVRASIDAMAQS